MTKALAFSDQQNNIAGLCLPKLLHMTVTKKTIHVIIILSVSFMVRVSVFSQGKGSISTVKK